ncbi:SDR family NAD(P)-dependent oxidoreductase, partial [Mycobacterium sp. 1245499.0]|uniref:SDR family NAD(P)-dependent oxidoreductase n=1 Tax=Mycobacterium sp. 1245499.0 TaxID=1834074 RepID=UPI0012EA7DDF
MTERPTALHIVDGIDLSGTTSVITGASSGLGRAAARALAAAGAHVILAARNADALAETARWIATEVAGARTLDSAVRSSSTVEVRA